MIMYYNYIEQLPSWEAISHVAIKSTFIVNKLHPFVEPETIL
jgi:hypothetical protein